MFIELVDGSHVAVAEISRIDPMVRDGEQVRIILKDGSTHSVRQRVIREMLNRPALMIPAQPGTFNIVPVDPDPSDLDPVRSIARWPVVAWGYTLEGALVALDLSCDSGDSAGWSTVELPSGHVVMMGSEVFDSVAEYRNRYEFVEEASYVKMQNDAQLAAPHLASLTSFQKNLLMGDDETFTPGLLPKELVNNLSVILGDSFGKEPDTLNDVGKSARRLIRRTAVTKSPLKL